MVNLELIFKEQEKYVEKIIEDIRKNNFSWEVLQYINNNYAEIEIEHGAMSEWNQDKYEEYLKTCNEQKDYCEIRINRDFVYRYINVHNILEFDRSLDDDEEEWEEYRDCYEEYSRKENEYRLDYVEFKK